MRSLVRSVWISFAVAAFIAIVPAVNAQNRDFSPSERAAMRAYVLTAQKMNAYIAGTNALAAAKKSDPAIAQEYEAVENEPHDTLADLRSSLMRHPRLFAYYQQHGLSVDDTVLLPIVLAYAGVAIAINNPGQFAEEISPTNLDFVRANPGATQRLDQAIKALEADDNDAKEPDDIDAKEPEENDAK